MCVSLPPNHNENQNIKLNKKEVPLAFAESISDV